MTFGGSGGGPVFIIIPQLCPHLVTMHMYATGSCDLCCVKKINQ